MRIKRIMAVLMTTLMLFSSIFSNVSLASAEPVGLKVLFNNNGAQTNSKEIYTNFKLQNSGTSNINLSDITIRYYFTKDDNTDIKFYTKSVSMGKVSATINDVLSVTDKANKYIDIKLSSGTLSPAGSKNPNRSEMTFQGRVIKSDSSKFDQSNDYSYIGPVSKYVENEKIAVYLSGELIYGSVPTTATPTVPSITELHVTATPKNTLPATTPPVPAKGEVFVSLDKTNAAVGDIITATLSVKEFDVIIGIQACMTYDPAVLMPVYGDGTPYDEKSDPEAGILIQKRFSPFTSASNDLNKGVLNFVRHYMDMAAYKKSGEPENNGSVAVIRFKVLKAAPTYIKLTDTPVLTNPVDGTMVFDWDANQLAGYKVTQAPIINDNIVTPTSMPKVYLTVDKEAAAVGEMIVSKLNIKFDLDIMGLQANIKYDPAVLMPCYADGTPYDAASWPEDWHNRFSPSIKGDQFMASNDLINGTLNFGRIYKQSVKEAIVATVRFKVLKNTPTEIKLENAPSLTNPVDGTMVFDRDGAQLSGYKVAQAPIINKVVSTPTSVVTPMITRTPTPTDFSNGHVYIEFENTGAKVGDIIKATLYAKYFKVIAGYQASIKYDPNILQPVYSENEPYDNASAPEYGSLLNKRFSPIDMAAHDLAKGILNFGRSYMNLSLYRDSGAAEGTGSLAVIGFKILKSAPIKITLENSEVMPEAVEGTLIYDWNGIQLKGYTVFQGAYFNQVSTEVPTPTSTPTPTPKQKGELYVTLDKTNAAVGDIITATLNVKDFDVIAGYMANIKYDPTVLMPCYIDGTPYASDSVPEPGTLIRKRYSPVDMASNDLINGVLNFGRAYMNLENYKRSGVAETAGSLAIIGFKVLKNTPAAIKLENSEALVNAVSGTMLFDWDGAQLSNYKVTQAPIINNSTPSNASVILSVDKLRAFAGEIITATLSVEGFQSIGGYQATVKYDPSVLQPVYSDGTPYDPSSVPEYGTLLQKRFSPVDMALNDLTKGILTFGRTYMNMSAYRSSGVAENTGSLAVIHFKVLKYGDSKIMLENSLGIPDTVEGTMIFDWNSMRVSDYKVKNNPTIGGPTPTPTPTTPISKGEVYVTVDKTTAQVGDIIKATINVKDFDSIAAYQAIVKYDPSVLQPVYADGTPYDSISAPDHGMLLNKRFTPVDIVTNDLVKGILNFGRSYMNMWAYKAAGVPEKTGSLAMLYFKVLKAAPANITLENTSFLSNPVGGTMIFDWDGNQLAGYKVTQAQSVVISGPTPTPTPTPPVGMPEVYVTVDKTSPSVGDIITATLNVKNFDSIIAYQACLKYDPYVLKPVYADGTSYDSFSVPEYGTLLQKRYSPVDHASHNLIEGDLNFGRIYMDRTSYRNSGIKENNGSLAVVRFKVLKSQPTKILLENSPAMTKPVDGTMVFDWDSNQLSAYKVTQAPAIYPVSTTPTIPPRGKVEMSFDKTYADVGDLVKAEIRIKGIENFAGYQFNIKYDPDYLQPWDTSVDAAYTNSTMPDLGTLLMQKQYSGTNIAVHDLTKGILNFGRAYMDLSAYKASGRPESSGTAAFITFKVIKKIPDSGSKVSFAYTNTMSDVNGILLFNWNGEALKSNQFGVEQPAALLPVPSRPVIVGDVDCDGNVDSDDYSYMRQYLLGIIDEFPGGEEGLKAADVDGDGNFDSDDYACMRRWLIGMINEFPAEVKV
ncbi:MAG TPA: cohesin domain-containing protein [Pseudobacteroides sp.]|uniref:cohesin domain-containing protein n=1 Tax=Pseudobacteroides sp. TaxID=1968840 RepID=UPI002F94235F